MNPSSIPQTNGLISLSTWLLLESPWEHITKCVYEDVSQKGLTEMGEKNSPVYSTLDEQCPPRGQDLECVQMRNKLNTSIYPSLPLNSK